MQQIASNTTIVLAPGAYQLTSTLYINGAFTNIGIRGATNNRDDVVLRGPGMMNAAYGNVPHGIWTGGQVQGVTIANLTIRDLYFHPIMFNAGTENPRVYNVHLIDAGQQFIKSNPDGAGGGVDNGLVEYSVIEYTTTAKDYYTNGVDVHTGANWIIRHNLFRNIVAPPNQLAGPAILIWNTSRDTLTEGNAFLNCARGIAYGLVDKSGAFDHVGGIIRNNFFHRSSTQPGDVAIGVADSPNTEVLNNTTYLSGTYSTPIEYRFTGTTGAVLKNNLLDGFIWARDGATGTEQNNLTGATAGMFVNAAAGDLHLAATATSAIDHGVALANVTDDWDGQARPIGASQDIGADEFGAADTTPPAASMTAPANGATVSGSSVTVSATASDNVGVAGVQFLLDGAALGAEDTSAPYSIVWNTTSIANGAHTLAARARDTAGNQATSASISVTVANSSGAPPAIDTVVWGDQAIPSFTVTTSAFSTTAGNELLLAFISSDAVVTTSVTGVTGAGLTWQLVRRTNVQLGTAEIWRAFAPAALANVTVTATLSAPVDSSITVVSFSGVDTSGANGSGAVGATASANANPGAPSATLVTTRNNSWVFGVGMDWDNPIPRTLGPNQTMVHEYMPPVGDTYWVQRRSSPTPLAGTSVTINAVAPTGDRYNLTICEIRAPLASDATPPTVSMTAPPNGATVSGSSVTVSASATDNVSVIGVQFLLDGASLGAEDTSAPYSIAWNPTSAANGAHTLGARARDAAGNQTTSASVSVTVSNGGGGGGGSLVQSTNLVYQGAFRVPRGTFGGSSFDYGGTALAFNAARNSLFLVGHDWHQQVAEVAVPAIINGSSLSDLATASVLQPFTDASEGRMYTVDEGTIKVGGLLIYQNRLYSTAYTYYDGDANQVLSHIFSGPDLGIPGDARGPYQVGTMGAGWVAGYFGLVPAAWQATLGGPVLNGQCCLAIISRTSFGPAVFTIDPANLGITNPLPATPLVYYTQTHPLAPENTQNAYFNLATEVKGVVFPEGTRSVLFFGRHGVGPYCYGTGGASGGDCYDPDDSSKGTHAYPYRYYVWAYDANDLAAVKAGQKQPWEVIPYAVWSLPLPFAQAGRLLGAAYDPATNRIFVSQAYGDNEYPVIHVLAVQVP